MALFLWLLALVSAQDIGPLVDFSREYPDRLSEDLVMNVIAGDFILEAELGLETNFEDVDRVLRGTLGQICQHGQFNNAPVTVERFLDMDSLVLRRKAFRYKWWILPLQSHPLPGNCMSSLAQMSFGPSEPPYEEIGKKIPPMRTIFAMELASYTATVAMDSTSWGLTLRNVSCLPHDVRRAVFDGEEESSTTPIPTHVCDGRLYATGAEQEAGFDPLQVADCGLAKEDPCLCLTLKDCEWQPGSGDIPGGCAATANPGVSCQACPFQEKCVEPTQQELCRLASNGCDCAFTRVSSNGYGCTWLSGACVSRSTADSAATSCDACPTQVRCGTPVLYTITPNAGTLMGEMGVWTVQVYFDRPIYAQFKLDDTGIAMRCNTWEPTGGTIYRLSQSKLAINDNVLEIDLRNVVSDKRKTCLLSISTNVLRSVQSNLPYGGKNDGAYFVFLPDTEEPTVSEYQPANSARGLGGQVEVSFTFTEPVYPSREATAHHVELYLTGNVANAGRLLETIGFGDERVTLKQDLFKVQLSGLEPSKFYSVVLPPLALNDAAGNNFTGIPKNFYIFGTGSVTTVDDVDWSDTLFIVLGVALVATFVAISGVVGYVVMRSGRQNARIFAKQVRTKSKGVSQADPVHVEDLDDGFYAQKPAVDEATRSSKAEGSSAVEVFRQQHHVTVAWDAGSKPAGLEHSSSSLSATTFSRSGGHSHQLQARSVSPHHSPRTAASPRPGSPRACGGTPRPGSTPRPNALTEGFGSRSGSQVAALHAQRGEKSLTLPGSVPKGKSPSSKETPSPQGRALSKTLQKSDSKISVHSVGDVTRVQVPINDSRARPQAPGGGRQGPRMPAEPSPELAGVSMLERGNSKMSLSGSWQANLTSSANGPSTLAESAAVSRSMSKALRSNSRPLSRGQQPSVRRTG